MRHLAALYCENRMVMSCIWEPCAIPIPAWWGLGPNTGYDSIGRPTDPAQLGALLDDLARTGYLPRTVLYGLNPADNPVLATMAVNFADSEIPGKVQFGSAWWFLDNARGIAGQLDELLETGLISTFVGMLTDSRSFLSFPRHEYFRRILCDKLGAIIDIGEYAPDIETIGGIVQDICYRNAVRFFSEWG